ncbi:HAMP domain-containing sensor histidine kinase [Evansella sp. AB-P1]|uniref:HAMP domain-containing sensor histidine kinase n=1 Tax=Evansella sp. AB-P1 TaxID=3037653 RepID=UPI00241FEF21|nr:HAMP domain-containing sensor histidine kinase [Evansella sp. AB-P1]MDG5788963.1 HAMP domain-containing sensor histidine kinase [Evansella sp. AB-P1]
MIKRRGMFIKLFSTYLFILFISFIVIGLVVTSFIQNEIINRYHNAFDHQSEQLVDYFELADREGWEEDTFTSSLQFAMDQEDRMVFLVDSEGNIKYNSELFEAYDTELNILDIVLEEEEVSKRLNKNDHIVYLMMAPIELNGENPDHTLVMIFHEFDTELKQMKFLINMTILIAIIVAGIIIFFTSRKMTSPLREMNHSALQFAKGDFSHRVTIRTKDEIGQLGETFNYMAKELGSIDQMRKDFVANVSHDLRSPLTSIRGFLGALMDGTIPSDQQYKYFSIMKNETERLMKLVEDLLEMARLEADQVEMNPDSYNISEQIRLIIAKMEPTISEHQIEIEMLGEEEDVFVVADPYRIDQVLINLLQNAIQFSNTSGKIEVNIEKQGEYASICIRDYGIGMAKDSVKHIWERFYKKEKSRSNKGGTGIGLSIVKHIIDLHETTIHVDSELGKGTTFTFTLPLAKEGLYDKNS